MTMPTITPLKITAMLAAEPYGLAALYDCSGGCDGGGYPPSMCWQAFEAGELHELEGADLRFRISGREYRVVIAQRADRAAREVP